jgi:dolichyl-phosphate beta-glucosyltransferase
MTFVVDKDRPFVSIVIPLHNEQHRMYENITKVIRYGEKYLGMQFEILLVDNGSTDDTYLYAKQLQATYRPVKAFSLAVRSKAAAVKHGMLQARGAWRYMCDVDLSTPIENLFEFIHASKQGWDVIIGSREHPQSRVDTTSKRWLIGRIFHLLVKCTVGMDYRDTQCGFKLFNGRAAEQIFSHMQCTSMAFDVEVLYLAQKMGYYCTEVPVIWDNDPDTRVRLLQDSWSMLRDLLKIREWHSQVQPEYKNKIPA